MNGNIKKDNVMYNLLFIISYSSYFFRNSTDSGKYQLEATNDLGTASSIANIDILPLVNESVAEQAPLFTSLLKDIIVNEGSDIELSTRFIGTQGFF